MPSFNEIPVLGQANEIQVDNNIYPENLLYKKNPIPDYSMFDVDDPMKFEVFLQPKEIRNMTLNYKATNLHIGEGMNSKYEVISSMPNLWEVKTKLLSVGSESTIPIKLKLL